MSRIRIVQERYCDYKTDYLVFSASVLLGPTSLISNFQLALPLSHYSFLEGVFLQRHCGRSLLSI